MSRLVSSTILHRHGSRGPGASELSPFSPENPVCSQWQENEMEMLSSVGHSQIEVLGAWFAKRSVQSGLLDAGNGRTHWRSSKSDRAFESGIDFVKGYNDALGSQVVGPRPLPYEVDADNYFRPWKVFKKEATAIKERMNTDENWKIKATENEAFLLEISQQGNCLPNVVQSSTKALWCTTYFHALREVENFWPKGVSTCDARDAFCKSFSSDTQATVTALALWVWEQRFLHCGYNCEMGGRISVDMVECALNRDFSVNIFSGHDYTLLSVLAALNLVKTFEYPTGFGAYLLFEVWETGEDLVVKVIFNADPFRCDNGSEVDMSTVNERNEVVLTELTVSELSALVQSLRDQISLFPPPKAIKVNDSVDMSSSINFGSSLSPMNNEKSDEVDQLS